MKRVVLLFTPLLVAAIAYGMQSTHMMRRPMTLQGTTLSIADTSTGVEVLIATDSENVAELRNRVQQMAGTHSGDPSSPAMMQGQMMPGAVKYGDVPGLLALGARCPSID